MTLTSRQKTEQQIYNQLADQSSPSQIGTDFPLPNREHSDFFPFFLSQIGNVQNKSILEIGSGNGYLSCWLAKKGAWVAGIDVSQKFVQLANQTASQNQVSDSTLFQVAVAEKLPFEDNTFDLIVGNQILHHLEIAPASSEISRVLKPGGKAIFCEPIGLSPSLEKLKTATKKFLKHQDHRHTPDEKILDQTDWQTLQIPFSKIQWKGFQLFSTKLTRLWSGMPDLIFHPLSKTDQGILTIFPFLKKLSRLAVIILTK